jgi:hypothetical protein
MVLGILEDLTLSRGEAGLLGEVTLQEPGGSILHGCR